MGGRTKAGRFGGSVLGCLGAWFVGVGGGSLHETHWCMVDKPCTRRHLGVSHVSKTTRITKVGVWGESFRMVTLAWSHSSLYQLKLSTIWAPCAGQTEPSLHVQ